MISQPLNNNEFINCDGGKVARYFISARYEGFEFDLNEIGEQVRYIRILVKFPNWQNTNCVNIGEISLYGDDL